MIDETVRTITKNRSEEIRVGLTEYRGNQLAFLRVYADPYADKGQGRVPVKKGLSFAVHVLPHLIYALQETERRAREAGLLEDESEAA